MRQTTFPTNLSIAMGIVNTELNGLGPKLIICGPPASGKTTIIHGMQLPLTGAIDELGFRASAKAKHLILDKKPESSPMFSTITLSNGLVAEWHNGNIVNESKEVFIFPMGVVQKVMAGSLAGAVNFFSEYIIPSAELINAESLVNDWMSDAFTFSLLVKAESQANPNKSMPLNALSIIERTLSKNTRLIKEDKIAISRIKALQESHKSGTDKYKNCRLIIEQLESKIKAADVSAYANKKKLLAAAIAKDLAPHLDYVENSVNQYLTSNLKFGIAIEGSSIRIGRRLGLNITRATSGSETARIAAAVSCLWAKQQADKNFYVVLPDKAYGAELITSITNKLEQSNAVIIVQTTEKSPKVSGSWSLVRTKG